MNAAAAYHRKHHRLNVNSIRDIPKATKIEKLNISFILSTSVMNPEPKTLREKALWTMLIFLFLFFCFTYQSGDQSGYDSNFYSGLVPVPIFISVPVLLRTLFCFRMEWTNVLFSCTL